MASSLLANCSFAGGLWAPSGVEPPVLENAGGEKNGEAEAETNAEDVGDVGCEDESQVSTHGEDRSGEDAEEVSVKCDDGVILGFARELDAMNRTSALSALESGEEDTCLANLTTLADGKGSSSGEGENANEDGDVVKGGATEESSSVSAFAVVIRIEVCEEEGGEDPTNDEVGEDDDRDDVLTARNSASM